MDKRTFSTRTRRALPPILATPLQEWIHQRDVQSLIILCPMPEKITATCIGSVVLPHVCPGPPSVFHRIRSRPFSNQVFAEQQRWLTSVSSTFPYPHSRSCSSQNCSSQTGAGVWHPRATSRACVNDITMCSVLKSRSAAVPLCQR